MTDIIVTGNSASERRQAIHDKAMSRFDAIWTVVQFEREQALRDRRFAMIRGAQWEGQYAFGQDVDENGNPIDTGAPRMEVPKFYRPIRRAIGEYRGSRKTVDFRAKGSDATMRSANTLDGLYRADENDTRGGGQAAYDNAFGEAILGGFGGWRYRTRYEDESDEDNEHQRIGIEPIYDADQRLFFDLDAQEQNKDSARFAFLLTTMSKDAFQDAYPKASPTTFENKLSWVYDWVQPDLITLAEYYVVEDQSVTRRTFRNVATEEEQTWDDERLTDGDVGQTLEDELLATGWEEIRSRKIKRQRVRKYLLNGVEVLKDEGFIAGSRIPLVPLYAERSYVDGIERSRGMVRPIIDATRIYNVMVSNLVEGASGPAEGTPIAAPEQIQGNIANIWATRKIKRPAILPLHPILDNEGNIIQAGLSGTLPAAEVSPATAALIQVASADIMDLLGDTDRPTSVPSNTSAQAIELVNDESDVADYLWKDNFSLAMACGGEIWLGMAKEVYVEEGREMIAFDAEGEQSVVTLATPALDDEGGQYLKNDLTTGDYDVIVDVGPATKTRRDATVRAMIGIGNVAVAAGQNDWAQGALGVAIQNMEGEGIDGYRDWIRKQGLGTWIEPNEEERKQLEEAAQNQQPDPQQQLIQAATMQAEAEAALAQSKTAETEAKAELARANTAKVIAGIETDKRDGILKAIEVALKAG